jgi:hypothetical protein
MNVNSGGGSSGLPFRSMANAGTFAYGCPPIDQSPFDLERLNPPAPVYPVGEHAIGCQCFTCQLKSKLTPVAGGITLIVCPKCNQHQRLDEPCPWCMSADIRKLLELCQSLNTPNATLHTQLEATRAALRKAIETLRAFSAVANGALDPLIAECEKAL